MKRLMNYRKTRFSWNEFLDSQGAKMVNFHANYGVNENSPRRPQPMKGIYVDRPIPQGITITFYLGPYQSQMMARLKRTKLTVLHGKAS
jgi:hypothetical protein